MATSHPTPTRHCGYCHRPADQCQPTFLTHQQTVFEVASGHYVMARKGWKGKWDVVETTGGVLFVYHDSYASRVTAETVASKLAHTLATPAVAAPGRAA